MSFMVIFDPPSMSTEQYEQAMHQLEKIGASQPDGRIVHVCYGDSPKLKILTVWRSREDFAAMGPKLLPVLKTLGIEAGVPEIQQVSDIQIGK
jgi:allophanate hydrolase subunit 1